MNLRDLKIRLITESLIFFDHRMGSLGYRVRDFIHDLKTDCGVYGRRVICRDEDHRYYEIRLSGGTFHAFEPVIDTDPIIEKIHSYFEKWM